ncbi:hypothetical protein VNO77_21180 [Canavalia gladiata]|uniref:Uncharacterized protein n=1 Tax=Canavalia gladiata TaxID=3824 RepID=A0AAN9QN56_CANGL
MGEVHVQSQHEGMVGNSPRPTTPTITVPRKHTNSPSLEQQQHIDHSAVEPTDLFSMMHLNNACLHRQPPCTTAAANNSMKRRSPPCSSSSGEPSAKKLFCDQEDLTLHGFSAIPLPLNLSPLVNKKNSFPVLRRCVSDPYHPPAPVSEHSTPPPRGSGLPPLPPSLRRSVSDLTPSPEQSLGFCRSLSSEETTITPDSMRLRRMKDRLKEMRQWWDEVMKEEEEGEEGEEECAVPEVAEEDKVLSQDELGGGDSEEAVNVEWAEKCLSLIFRCPCGKGYEVLLSENSCYYKLITDGVRKGIGQSYGELTLDCFPVCDSIVSLSHQSSFNKGYGSIKADELVEAQFRNDFVLLWHLLKDLSIVPTLEALVFDVGRDSPSDDAKWGSLRE